MKSIKRNFASLGVRKGAARCKLASSQIGGGSSSRFISRLLITQFTFFLLFALTYAQGAWAATVINSASTLTGISKNTLVEFRDEGNGDGLIMVKINGIDVTNEYISITSTSKNPTIDRNNYLKLEYTIEVRFKLIEQATLEITYDSSCKTSSDGKGGEKVYITGEDGEKVSFLNSRTEIGTSVKLQPGTYKITRVSGTTNITSFKLMTLDPSPDEDATVRILSVGRSDAPGTFSYNTIDAAIDAVGDGERAIIYLGSGTFPNVNIGSTGENRKYISIVGENKATTVFSSDKHRGKKINNNGNDAVTDENYVGDSRECAALNIYTPRFYGENFTVVNKSLKQGGEAEALNTEGDGFVFNNIQAKGYQNTYRSNSGKRGYIKNSTFVGATDFVSGSGTVWFEGSELQCLKDVDGNGWIVSPEAASSSEIMRKSDYPLLTSFNQLNSSFFINNCDITAENGVGGDKGTASNSYYLGRPNQNGSGAVFMKSSIDAHVNTEQLWDTNGKSNFTYLYYNNSYTPHQYEPLNLPDWAKRATEAEVNNYLNPEFLFGHLGSTVFDYDAMSRSVSDPYNIVATPFSENEVKKVTITWDCPAAAGYILYKDGVYDRILTDASFTRLVTDKSYYAVKALSRYGVTTQAISLGGGTLFEYELTTIAGTLPECNITSKQNNISLDWSKNAVRDGGDDAKVDGKARYYMKSSSTAFTLTGNFKEGDVLTLKVYNYDKQSRGIKVKEDDNVSTEIGIPTAPTTQQLYEIIYTIANDCNTIEVLRVNDDDNKSGLYINHIKVARINTLTVISDKTYREIEMGTIELSKGGYQLPYVKGIDNEGYVHNGTPKYTIPNDGIAKIENNKIVPIALGTTKMTVTYEDYDNGTVSPCEITIKVVKSCIKTIVAKKSGEDDWTVTGEDGKVKEKVGCFIVNESLEANLFYEGYSLDLTLCNPYDDGSEVFYRYHIHDNSSEDINYSEGSGTLTSTGGKKEITFTGLNNSFVIYTEHRKATGEVLWTSTYEFIRKDDLMYYVAETGIDKNKLTLTITGDGEVLSSDGKTTRASEFSVRGLNMTYGGTYNGLFGSGSDGKKKETWTYQQSGNNDKNKYIGSDGVLTSQGYSLVSWQIPFTEDPDKRYDHRFSMKGIEWNGSPYNNGQGQLVKATTSTGTFALPVIGGYLKFEPEQNGTIILHIFQGGNTYSNGSGDKLTKGVENRPFYFLDEAGRSQKLKSYRTTSYINFDEYNDRIVFKEDNKLKDDEEYNRRACNAFMFKMGYAKPSETRPTIKGYDSNILSYNDEDGTAKEITVGDGQVVPTAQGRLIPQKVMVLHSAANPSDNDYASLPEYIRTRLGGQYSEDLVHYIGNSAGGSFNKANMKDGTGYMLITDGFIKYAFDVKAGKTYFPFVMGARFGMCGYEFIPNQTVGEVDATLTKATGDHNSTFYCNNLTASTSYDNDNKGNKEITLSGAENANNLSVLAGVTKGGQYDVKLINRKFTAGQWTPIVLPFSVSQTKLKKLFGADTQVLHFDYIKHEGRTHTLMLRKHYYDMIVAGTPVFIRTGQTVEATETNPIVFNNVTIDVTEDRELDPVSNYVNQTSEMKSSFNDDEIPTNGLYVSGNKFYQNRLSDGKTIKINPLRGWIKTSVTVSTKAKMTNVVGDEFEFEDETQGIDFIEIDDGISRTTYSNDNVYNLKGQKVGSSFTELNSLPNGIYIVNGKKYTVENK